MIVERVPIIHSNTRFKARRLTLGSFSGLKTFPWSHFGNTLRIGGSYKLFLHQKCLVISIFYRLSVVGSQKQRIQERKQDHPLLIKTRAPFGDPKVFPEGFGKTSKWRRPNQMNHVKQLLSICKSGGSLSFCRITRGLGVLVPPCSYVVQAVSLWWGLPRQTGLMKGIDQEFSNLSLVGNNCL